MDIPHIFRAYAIDILYMRLTFSTQILHIFPTCSLIPTQIVSHIGPRGPVPSPNSQQAGPGPGSRRLSGAWSKRNVRGEYAEGGCPANSAQDSPHANPTYIFHTFTSYIQISHTCSMHIPYIFNI